MIITLQQAIIIGALLAGSGAQAAGFATADVGPQTTICMGVNGSGQAAEPKKETCGADARDKYKPSVRGRYS